MKLRNKQGHEIVLGEEWKKFLKQGPVHFLRHSMVEQAFISAFLILITLGLFWFIVPIFAKRIVVSHYVNHGYEIIELDSSEAAPCKWMQP